MSKIGFESLNDEKLRSELKALLKGKIFIANYKEKRLCSALKTYRDIVEVELRKEKEFSFNLLLFLSKVNEKAKGIHAGVTHNDEGSIFTLWTELDEISFGKFWFQVETVEFSYNEIQIKLKTLRPIDDDADTQTYAQRQRKKNKKKTKKSSEHDVTAMGQWRQWTFIAIGSLFSGFTKIVKHIGIFVIKFLEQVICLVKVFMPEALRVIEVFFNFVIKLFKWTTGFVSVVVRLIEIVLNFVTKLAELATCLVNVLVPVALGLIGLTEKITGGMFYLTAMVWKDSIGGVRLVYDHAIEGRQQRAIGYYVKVSTVQH